MGRYRVYLPKPLYFYNARFINMAKYKCTVCGYIYDPAVGDSSQGIKPGTAFQDLSDSWVCPDCGVGKDMFEKVDMGGGD